VGARTYWRAPVPPLGTADGPTYTTLATLGDISPVPPVTVPAILELGTRVHVRAHGSVTSSGTGTAALGVYWTPVGSAIGSGIALGVSTAAATVSSASAVWPWVLYWEGEVRGLSTSGGGSTGSVKGAGQLWLPASVTQFQAPYSIPATDAAKTVSVPTATSNNLMIGATITTAVTNIICQHLTVELIG
jgi:hypothetical protein